MATCCHPNGVCFEDGCEVCKQPKPVPSREDCAYAAGIIDGEGCIIIAKRRPKPSYYELHVRVQTTDDTICPWLHKMFGGSLCREKYEMRHGWKRKYVWSCSAAAGENFLRMIFPWIKLKKDQVELAFLFRATHKRDHWKRTPHEIEVQGMFFSQMKALKTRGRIG